MKFTILLLLLAGTTTARAQAPKCPPPPSHISVASGTFSNQEGVSFVLRHFEATLLPDGKTAPLCYGKTTVVTHAEIFVDSDSLTKVFSSKLSDSQSKIKDFKVVNAADGVTLSGTLRKVIPIHFSIFGPVTTDGTGLRLEARTVKADGIPIKALLALVGKHLSSVLGMKGVRGVVVVDNTISFFPEQIAHIKGHIHTVTTSPEGLTLVYTPSNRAPRATRAAAPAEAAAPSEAAPK